MDKSGSGSRPVAGLDAVGITSAGSATTELFGVSIETRVMKLTSFCICSFHSISFLYMKMKSKFSQKWLIAQKRA